jgi:hypothetical protein
MTVAQLLDACRARIPYPVMLAILRVCGLPLSNGWKKTIDVILGSYASNPEFQDNFDDLKRHYYEHLLVGEKSVKLFNVGRSRVSEIANLMDRHRIGQTGFHDTYPFPLNEETLAQMDSEPHLMEVLRDHVQNNISLIFCSKRFFLERKEIDVNELTDEAKQELQAYDEIFGIKRYNRQFFDVITLWPQKGIIEVRVDIGTGLGLNTKEQAKAFSSNISVFLELLSLIENQPKEANLFKDGMNFFPLIGSLYHSEEGRVVELGFTTDAGSTKLEKMRKSYADLREEAYHKAGKEAVDHITLFRVSIIWDIACENDATVHPELSLPGHVKNLSDSTQLLSHAIVRKCSSTNDYLLIFGKILQYLHGSDQ